MTITVNDEIKHHLAYMIKAGETARSKLLAKLMQTNSAAISAISWMEQPTEEIALAALAETVIGYTTREQQPVDLIKALVYVVKSETRKLMQNQYRGGSTSQFHNATETAQRAAAVRFIEAFSHIQE